MDGISFSHALGGGTMRLCATCHDKIKPVGIMPGSGMATIALYLCGILPGLIYSAWRSAAKYTGCPQCSGRDLIPMDSPRAKSILKIGGA